MLIPYVLFLCTKVNKSFEFSKYSFHLFAFCRIIVAICHNYIAIALHL